MIRHALFLLATGAVLVSLALPAPAQTQAAPPTPLEKQLARVDLGVSGIGQFNQTVTGVVPRNSSATAGQTVSENASNTLGAFANVRYTAKPYVGLEFNYTYARYTETFNVAPNQIQTGVNEFSFGYLVTPRPQVFGLQPFVSVGAGSTRFRPTRGGGQSAPTQYRATYYYNVGLQKEFGESHFGARVSFRQAFFLAPDFLLNYLTILKHTNTVEPTVGFYARF